MGATSRSGIAVTTAVVAYAAAIAVGQALTWHGLHFNLGDAVPLSGHLDIRLSRRTLLPVAVAALLLLALPFAAQRLPWRWLLGVCAAASAGWAISLALVDGVGALGRPISTRAEYLADVPRVSGLHAFLTGFTDHIVIGSPGFAWATHVSGHPPGALLTFVALDRLGLGGAGWAAGLCIGAGASAAAAGLVTLRAVAGEDKARAAAPFLTAAPAAVWIATSADAWFLGVSAWGIACLALGARRKGVAGDLLAAGGGVLLGVTANLSYGLVLLAPVVVTVTVGTQRRLRPLAVAVLTAGAVVALIATQGFWWLDGLTQTRIRYQQGSASARTYLYFLFANLAVLGVVVGPATVACLPGIFRRRRAAVALLPLAALAGILLADISGLSKSEVERIWLPFTPWLLAATAVLPVPHRRWWLCGQLAVGLAVQTLVRTNW